MKTREEQNMELCVMRNAVYDCVKFNAIRDRMQLLIGELQCCEDSAEDWYPRMAEKLESLRVFIESWSLLTQEISEECRLFAEDFKAKL